MSNTPDLTKVIKANRDIISDMMAKADMPQRLNNMNWLRQDLSYAESMTLFKAQGGGSNTVVSMQMDYNYIRNVGYAYDYILENAQKPIDTTEICKIHSILCMNTPIAGGSFRTTDKVLEINVNGIRYHAPDYHEIASKMNNIIFKLNNPDVSMPQRAFNLHFDLIMLQPFDDFNKRTSRLIMNWALIQNGYRPVVFNNKKDAKNYISAIAARANDNNREYNYYMSAAMVNTQKQIIKRLERCGASM